MLEYWYVILGVAAVIAVLVLSAVKFFNMPTDAQIQKVKEVLLFWVLEAEKELGGGTGQIKLRYVYDLFVMRFPTVAKVISFETFSKWVDEALEQAEEMLHGNEKLVEYIGKQGGEEDGKRA